MQGPHLVLQVLHRFEVGGDVVPDRGVRARPRLHGGDPLRREHGLPQQELGVLPRVDVVRDDRERQLVPQRPAERGDGRRLPGPDGPTEPDAQSAPRTVGPTSVGTDGRGPVVGVIVVEMHDCGSKVFFSPGRHHPARPAFEDENSQSDPHPPRPASFSPSGD